jgi:hypothetical protein
MEAAMSPMERPSLLWIARLAGLGISLFLALFALDAFDGRPLGQALPAFAIHLGPAALCAAVVAVGWRLWWAGALGFAGLAAAYAVSVYRLGTGARLDWIAVISGPLMGVALLYVLAGLVGPRGSLAQNNPRDHRKMV